MYCTREITGDLIYVGASDRRLWMFEGQYAVPDGVSYNSYLLLDERTVLFDTVDKAVGRVFFENVAHALGSRKLDYLIVQHMEPDHSATLHELLLRHPETVIVCNQKIQTMLFQFYGLNQPEKVHIVKEGDVLDTGRHKLQFLMAPMVHWPEVMVTYDQTDRILFSADAFGTFGALSGALFADEVDFMRDHLDEARRYYCNIVGKYGQQVQGLLKKASALDIAMICPLHGFVWRKNLMDYLSLYRKWSSYEPEEEGVMIAYASIYGNTENTAEILASRLREKGIPTAMFDVSVKPAADIIAAAFRFSHLVFASTTYNAGIFSRMEDALIDLTSHNIQNRTVALIENGSWAATSGRLMKEMFEGCKDIRILEETVSIQSALKESQLAEVNALADAIEKSMPKRNAAAAAALDPKALFKLSYGLFVISAKDGEKDNGCINNTVMQITVAPDRIAFSMNKTNYTHDMIQRTGVFNVSVLTEETPFSTFTRFGFQSGRDADKFDGFSDVARSENGLYYLTNANAFFSCRVVQAIDCGSHTLFVADITESAVLSDCAPATYAYYFAHIKPKPAAEKKAKGWVCSICGYVYEGETLPSDFVCPLCKHGAEFFEELK